MATYTGKDGEVKITGAGASDTEQVVAEVRDFSVEQTAEVVSSTVMGDSWVSNKATLRSFTASINCFFKWASGAADVGQVEFAVGDEVTLALYPTGDSSNQQELTGSAIVTSVSQSQSFDGLVELAFSCTGTGALSINTVS